VRRALVVAAGLLVLGVLVVAGLIVRDRHLRAEAKARWLVETRREAGRLVPFCTSGGLAVGIKMATSNFRRYITVDRPRAREVLDRTVMPVIDTQETACSTARTVLESYRRDVPPDAWVEKHLTLIDRDLEVIARTQVAAAALKAGLVAPASDGGALWGLVLELRRAAESPAVPSGE
jgi:hypothetical protein